MEINKITEIVIGNAIEVHKHLGPGLLESTYETCLYYELIRMPSVLLKTSVVRCGLKSICM